MRTRLLTLLLLAAPVPIAAQGWIVPRCIRPMDVPRQDVRRAPCPSTSAIVRTRSDVAVRLEGRVLHYEIEERFVNRGQGVGEADYLFPLPKGAAFQGLALSIDGELVSGETMNAGEARRIYEEIVRRQRDPALVEWMGYGLLRARIFPIAPGEEKRVVVRFDAVAEREGDALRVDYFRGGGAAGAASFALTYDGGSALGTPYSPTHLLDVDRGGRSTHVRVRGDASDVTILFPLRRSGAPAIAALPHAPGNEDGFVLVTLTPPVLPSRDATPRDVTLVLDVSGSMSGRKMEQARAAGKQLLRTLSPRDRFRIIDFATDVRSFRDEPVYATRSNVAAAERYLDALEASGSTNISGALTEALRVSGRGWRDDAEREDDRLALVLFVTDGAPTVGERRPEAIAELASRQRGDARVFTFGLGSDVNAALLERLALEGRGTAQFVRPDESVERMVGVVASRLVDPVLTDVRVRLDGDVRLSKVLPQQPLDIFAGQDLVLLARYSGEGDAMLLFEGRRRGERVRWASHVHFPERERGNAFVARLWATQRVGLLAAERRRRGGSPELDGEIRSLGERFGIPTEFTSYLVQEPQLARRDIAGGTAGGVNGRGAAPAAAPSSNDAGFARAKIAAEQRATVSMAAVDAARESAQGARGSNERRVDARTFALRDGVWTDVRWRDTMQALRVRPYSAAYFDLVSRLPELRAVFALGDRVVVVGRSGAIRLDDAAGDPAPGAVEKLVRGW